MLDGYGKLSLIFESQRTSVWRAERLSDGLAVIVKRPRAEYPTASEIARFPHEHGILKQLEGAPGVVVPVELTRFGGVPAHRRDEAFRMNSEGWSEQVERIARHVAGQAEGRPAEG